MWKVAFGTRKCRRAEEGSSIWREWLLSLYHRCDGMVKSSRNMVRDTSTSHSRHLYGYDDVISLTHTQHTTTFSDRLQTPPGRATAVSRSGPRGCAKATHNVPHQARERLLQIQFWARVRRSGVLLQKRPTNYPISARARPRHGPHEHTA